MFSLCVLDVQAADDAHLQLGRTGSNVFGLLFMAPSLIIICVAVYGMLEAWWGGIIVIVAVNGLLAAIMSCWFMADHLEAVRNAAVLSRSVKFVLKLVMATGGILLLVFMINPATVGNGLNHFSKRHRNMTQWGWARGSCHLSAAVTGARMQLWLCPAQP